MEFLSCIADFFGEPRLYMHVDIFQSLTENKLSRFDFFFYFFKALHKPVLLPCRKDPYFFKHLRVGLTALNILFVKRPVKIN